MTWYIFRHCETLSNKLKARFCGETETLLTLKGIDQAKSIGHRLLNTKEDFSKFEFISSPLARTRHTMQIVLETLKLENKDIIEELLLKTKYRGLLEGMLREEGKAKYYKEFEEKEKNYWNWCPPGNGESYASEYQRVLKFVEKYKDKENLLICGHQGTISVLVKVLDGWNEEQIRENRKSLKTDQNYFYSYDKKNGVINL
ncbi:MAG: phosphoglycerate mutase family protein [Rickettsiales bacterium]|nr:phosphoglycerate mutase family protein [Rickettsiales bacterium]